MAIIILKEQAVGKIQPRSGVAANSLSLTDGTHFLKRDANGFIAIASGATDRIIGTNISYKSYASDNQTVSQAEVEYHDNRTDNVYEVTISGGTLSRASEGKLFQLSGDGVVNGATATVPTATSTTAASQINAQLELVRYISATKGLFRIYNA